MTNKDQRITLKSLKIEIVTLQEELNSNKKHVAKIEKELKNAKEEIQELKGTKNKKEEEISALDCDRSRKGFKCQKPKKFEHKIKCKLCDDAFDKNSELETHIKPNMIQWKNLNVISVLKVLCWNGDLISINRFIKNQILKAVTFLIIRNIVLLKK